MCEQNQVKQFSNILLFVILFDASGQTVIKNGTEIYGTWRADKSPYIIEGGAIIPKDQILTIEPGVKILFKSISTSERENFIKKTNRSGFIHVYGSFVAQGTKEEMILFDRYGGGQWGSIYFDSSSIANRLKYCQIQSAYGIEDIRPNVTTTGALVIYKSELEISNCLINDNWRGLEVTDSKLGIQHSSIVNNEEVGLMLSGFNKVEILNMVLWGGWSSLYYSPNSEGDSFKGDFSISYLALPKNQYHLPGGPIYLEEPTFMDPNLHNYEITEGTFYMDKGPNGIKLGYQ